MKIGSPRSLATRERVRGELRNSGRTLCRLYRIRVAIVFATLFTSGTLILNPRLVSAAPPQLNAERVACGAMGSGYGFPMGVLEPMTHTDSVRSESSGVWVDRGPLGRGANGETAFFLISTDDGAKRPPAAESNVGGLRGGVFSYLILATPSFSEVTALAVHRGDAGQGAFDVQRTSSSRATLETAGGGWPLLQYQSRSAPGSQGGRWGGGLIEGPPGDRRRSPRRSAFLSHSTRDNAFSFLLRRGLMAHGVDCFLAEIDLPGGCHFRQAIEDAIRQRDTFLVVVSVHSIASPEVAREVEAAIEREIREGRTLILPVRIDDAIRTTTVAWAADLRRRRQVRDFSGWAVPADYQIALGSVLRDLSPPSDLS
jgi:hypothetical protein